MRHKPYSLSKQLIAATALALGASSVALADDSSMSPWTGDSYKYFNGHNLGGAGPFNPPAVSIAPTDPAWRQSHRNGLSESDLQALSASGSSAMWQVNSPIFASAAAESSGRQRQPVHVTEHELQELSSSGASAVWQLPNGSENPAMASTGQPNVAGNPSKEALSVRFARFFHAESATQSGTN